MDKFGIWFTWAILGNWIIWSSYMAVKFLTEMAQHQHASMSVHGNTSVGGFIVIPIIISILGTILWTVFVAEGMD
jgi:hypothetical protein